ncbi:MAG: hypothetical protein NTV19_20240 [Burkholderiales bacterium]|nr:hypothetical protein [Burkholderiales bacterium]
MRFGSVVYSMLNSAPSATKNDFANCDPEVHHAKKGDHRYFGMNAQSGVNTQSALMEKVKDTTVTYITDVVDNNGLLHGDGTSVVGETCCYDTLKRTDAKDDVTKHVAMGSDKRKSLEATSKLGALTDGD